MARLPRLTLPGLPHYVLQRGNNLQDIFVDAQDYGQMRDLMREMARRFQVDVHAYALLPNQQHLLVTPQQAESLPQFMQSIGRSYVRYFNNRHGRSGTLWEGRYRATVLDAQSFLLPCMVVVESQPLVQGLVVRPQDYAWSSCAHHVGLQHDSLVRDHAQFWAMANTPFEREAAYQRVVEQGVSQQQAEQILSAAAKGWALGPEGFVTQLQQKTERRLTRQRAGRPVRSSEDPDCSRADITSGK